MEGKNANFHGSNSLLLAVDFIFIWARQMDASDEFDSNEKSENDLGKSGECVCVCVCVHNFSFAHNIKRSREHYNCNRSQQAYTIHILIRFNLIDCTYNNV